MTPLPYLVAGGLLLGLLDFAVASAGIAPLTLLAAVVTGIVSVVFGRYVSQSRGENLARMAVPQAAGAALLAALLQVTLGTGSWASWIGVILAGGTAWVGGTRVLPVRPDTCFVCKREISTPFVTRCPRCHQAVCGQPDCWNARYLRCRFCHDREVVILPTRDQWWQQQLGDQVAHGSCHSCYKEAHETDLRACGHCHWPTCRRCWDYHNGLCPRCGWVMPGLPADLMAWLPAARRGRDGIGPRSRRIRDASQGDGRSDPTAR